MTTAEFLSQFSGPDPRYTPTPAWWWSGEKLNWPRMRWQIDQMFAMGIRNIVIINLAPSGTLFGSEPDDPAYQSEEWWKYFKQTCDYARSLDVKIWFYDQIGFSGASFQAEIVWQHPEFSAEQLKCVRAEGQGDLQITCPGAGAPLTAYVVPTAAPGNIRYIALDGRVARTHVDEPSTLVLVYSIKQGFDFFNPLAAQKMLDTVHRQFEKRVPEHLGSTIVGSFQDELPEMPTWGPRFAQSFQQSFGYDLQNVVHRLFEEGDADSRQTRVHFHAHRADLAEAAFFKPFFDWHESHGLACSFDQQSPAREARVLGCVAKYADYMQVHQWYAVPGSDLHGNAKLHSSIAFLHDRKRVWLEGFHSTGWGGSIADTFDWMLPYFQGGANLYNPHAIYYSTKKGWWEWAPPSTCWRQPYAMHYPAFCDFIARLQKLISQGITQATAGVVFPSTAVQSAVGAVKHFAQATASDQVFHETTGSMRWHQAAPGPIDRAAIDYHVLDEPSIASAELRDAALVIRGVALRAIILPAAKVLHDATIEKLLAFAQAGGRLISIACDVVESTTGRVIDLRDFGAVILSSAELLGEQLQSLDRDIRSPLPFLHRKIGSIHTLFLPAVTGMATVVKWPSWFSPQEQTTIRHDRYARTAELTLPKSARSILRFDPANGSMHSLDSNQGQVHVDFGSAPFVVLCWSDKQSLLETTSVAPPRIAADRKAIATIDGTWTSEYVPTLPESFADIHDDQRPHQRWPHTVEMDWMCDGQAKKSLATFGPRALRFDADNATITPLVYSPEFGIAGDRMHINTIGPKGRVPEEFIDLGKCTKDQSITIRTGVKSAIARSALLAIGANAKKSALVNGQAVQATGDEYLAMLPVQLVQGDNPIDLKLLAEKDATIRLYWCLLEPEARRQFVRPERMTMTGAKVPGARLLYSKSFSCSTPTRAGRIKVSVAAMISIFIDDRLVGRQGGFDPYRPNMRGQIFDTPELPAGQHQIRVELIEPDSIAPLYVDFAAEQLDEQMINVVSDQSWTVCRDDGPAQPVAIVTRQDGDQTPWFLFHRPHPLPQSRWITLPTVESPADRASQSMPRDSAVLDLPLLPVTRTSAEQVFQWKIPPGALTLTLNLADCDSVQLWVDDQPVDASHPRVVIADQPMPARNARLTVRSLHLGGAVFRAPVTYTFGEGRIPNGNWLDHGLRSYSGAMRLRQSFHFDAHQRDGVHIDLGVVRGTVELKLNGQSAGVRVLAPYRFDVSQFIQAGRNEIELLVTNTLGNFMSTWSPSTWWSPDQLECGVFGPVTIG